MTHAIVTGLLALSLLPITGALQPNAQQDAPACENVILHEPLLQYEVSGSTLVGALVDRSLTVWADGTARLSEASDTTDGRCLLVQVSTEETQALHRALLQMGAFAACDEAAMANDLPLSTLTVFRGAQDARTHTFSWWVPQGDYAPFEDVLEKFITENFSGQ
jgi:hypothetical protein